MKELVRKRLLTINDPQQMRIYKDLAQEIGFEESVVLLQLEYLIATTSNCRDGHYWTFQSHRKLQKDYFPWWHHTTIGRIINNLIEKKLLIVGNYNKMPLDKTPWYALNEDGISKLKSVHLLAISPMEQNAASAVQNAPSSLQDAPSMVQIAATIPKNTTKNKNKNKPPLSPLQGESAKEPAQNPRRATNTKSITEPFPQPFFVTAEMRAWAKENAPSVNWKAETEKLKDWALSKGERKADWIATWRNWMRRRQDEINPKKNLLAVSGDELRNPAEEKKARIELDRKLNPDKYKIPDECKVNLHK